MWLRPAGVAPFLFCSVVYTAVKRVEDTTKSVNCWATEQWPRVAGPLEKLGVSQDLRKRIGRAGVLSGLSDSLPQSASFFVLSAALRSAITIRQYPAEKLSVRRVMEARLQPGADD